MILIECKSITEDLSRHDSQLFRYFGTTSAKFAILTNGVYYRFYTDLDDRNKMDSDPFLTINILDLRENQVPELKKFCKSVFDIDAIFQHGIHAEICTRIQKKLLLLSWRTPLMIFCVFSCRIATPVKKHRMFLSASALLRKALNDYISEMMNDKIKTALGGNGGSVSVPDTSSTDAPSQSDPRCGTSEGSGDRHHRRGTEAYFIIKNLLSEIVDIHDITYKDTQSYLNILYKKQYPKMDLPPAADR